MHIFVQIDWRVKFMQEVLGAFKSWPGWPKDVRFRMALPKRRIHLSRWRVDGAICCLNRTAGLKLAKRAVPCLVNLEWTRDGRIPPDIGMDPDSLCAMAVEHMLEMGFTTLAYYGWGDWMTESHIRRAGARMGMQVHVFKMNLKRQVPKGMRVWNTQLEQIAEWLSALPEGTGVICGNDYDGLAVMDLCQDIGRRVPDEIGVLGIGDDSSCREISYPPLTSIRLPARSLGEAAAARLVEMISAPRIPRQPLLLPPLGVAQRGSTQRVLCDDPLVRQALQFIQQRAGMRIRAEDVVAHVGISRTGLEQKMRLAIGRTPAQEIERVRMAAAERMLIETDAKVGLIAARCGFSRLEHFTRAFTRVHGIPPTLFRRR